MPYQAGQRLTMGERASKLGHLDVVRSEFVRTLIEHFEYPVSSTDETAAHLWRDVDTTGIEPLSLILAVDGSLQIVKSDDTPTRSLAFIKTALVRMDQRRIAKIDKHMPHPVQMKALMSESALQQSTVLPLRNVHVPGISNYDLVRNIIDDSLRIQTDGLAYETLKWIAYKKWWPELRSSSPEFRCPHCPYDMRGLPYDADSGTCEHCKGKVLLSDMIGFHLEMGEDQAPDSVASAYMLVHETLLLFSVVRHFWEHGNFNGLRNVLLIKDGPLALRGQYSKLVPNIRELLQYSRDRGCPIHLVGQEKTGRFVDHLAELHRHVGPRTKNEVSRFALLSHRYIRQNVDHAPDRLNPYGMKTNYGEKVLFKIDPYTSLALSIPTGYYDESLDFPEEPDNYIGLPRILATLPSLVSHQHEGALVPISLANGVASLSSYPSATVLKLFAGL